MEINQAHRASDDAEAAVRILSIFTADPRVPRTYAAFVQEQRRLSRIFEEERSKWKNSRG